MSIRRALAAAFAGLVLGGLLSWLWLSTGLLLIVGGIVAMLVIVAVNLGVWALLSND